MKKIFIAVICVLVLMVAGCSAAPAMDAESTSSFARDELVQKDVEMEDVVTEGAEPQEAAAEEGVDAGGMGSLPNMEIPDTSRKLVYTSSFTIETKQFDKDYGKIKQALHAVNGYLENESSSLSHYEYGSARYSQLTLRVPVDKYNEFMDTLTGIGSVRDKQISTQDISDQYFDTESRIDILEQQKDRLLEHLEEAKKMEDIIALEDELSEVMYELDQYKGSRRQMDGMVSYATAYVELTEALTADTTSATYQDDPLSVRTSEAYQMSVNGVGKFLEGVAIFFAAAAPVLVLLAVIAVAVLLVIKLVKYLKKRIREKRNGTK